MSKKLKKYQKNSITNSIFLFSQHIWLLLKYIRSITSWLLAKIFILFSAVTLTAVTYFYFILPPYQELLDGRDRGSVTFLDKNGEKFAWRGDQFDMNLNANKMNRHLVNAVISMEDSRFYSHFGISFRGILGAIRINLKEGRGPFDGHGGSTITQQVAKLLCLLKGKHKTEAECRRRSITRKILEVPFSIALELKFSKSEILSIYFNRVYLGAGATGFEAASKRYFNKPASEVSVAEAAMLAALLSAPSRYAPTRNLKGAQDRSKIVIKLMQKRKYLTAQQAENALQNPAILSKNAPNIQGAHFVDWVMSDAPDALTFNTTEDILIKTTFDPRIQKAVELAIEEVFQARVKENSKAQIAVVVLSSEGDVLSMVGGRADSSVQGQFNRAFQSLRQPGSAFKPFVFAAALEKGYKPQQVVEDYSISKLVLKRTNYWPKNYNDQYLGPISLSRALAESSNSVAVQLADDVGLTNIRALAKSFGIDTPISSNLATALGTSEVTLLDLTSAYAGFLNAGFRTEPKGWNELILKPNNEVLIKSSSSKKKRILSEDSSKYLLQMLREVVASGTGKEAQIENWSIAGKTGTSQSAKDAWFVGFTSDYVAGVWMGYDDNTPLTGVTGGGLPAVIWKKIMIKIHDQKPQDLNLNIFYEKYARPQKTLETIDQNDKGKSGVSFLQEVIDYLFN